MLQVEQILHQRYQLLQQFGQNAGRQTWLAQDQNETPPQQVIVKLLAFSPQMQWEEFKLFEREAQVLNTLNHAKIPKYRDYFSLDQHMGEGLCWFGLVQDYIPGHSLAALLNEGKRFTEAQVRSIATQVLEILNYLHGLNPPVLHRDIKPSNLILGEDGQVYLVDFGAVANPSAVEGVTFTVVGTAGYAPLEQFYGKAVPASDLYALGATLIHLLTGTSPADLPQNNLRIQFQGQVSLNSNFVRWIECLTEPDLDRRFSSATQALEALRTGSFLQNSHQPPSPRIQVKKARHQLFIKLPPPSLSLINLLKLSGQISLALASLLFLLLPSLLALAVIGISLFPQSSHSHSSLSISVLLILIPLVLFLGWSWRKAGKELARVLADLKETSLNYFGQYQLHFTREYLFLEKRFLFWYYRCKCLTSDIKGVNKISGRGITIETHMLSYCLGQGLTEQESEWLFQEIEEWL